MRRRRSFAQAIGLARSHARPKEGREIRTLAMVFLLLAAYLTVRLFVIQVLRHEVYAALASHSHELYKKIHADRGRIFAQDVRSGERFPIAINREYYEVYASPRIMNPSDVVSTTAFLRKQLGFSAERERELGMRLSRRDLGYQNIAHKVSSEVADTIVRAKISGIFTAPQDYRFYPEGRFAAAVIGFCARDERGVCQGRYGIEGYWQDKLGGKPGFVAGEKSAGGIWITLAGRTVVPAEHGTDVVLTIDRTLQFEACKRLEQGMRGWGALDASLIMMDPTTGKIMAMCSFPDFDPNDYGKTSSTAFFNNQNVFIPYEPGSVMKTVTMASALDSGLVTPETAITDPCKRTFGPFTIYNANLRCYGRVTMTEVLQKSINTGAIWVAEQLTPTRFKTYLDKFGFGEKTGITLNTEAAGLLPTFGKRDIANAAYTSFGQGMTATPLQIALAYSTIANGGKLMRPLIVEEWRNKAGEVEKSTPEVVDTVLSERAAKITTGMLVATLDSYKKTTRLEQYYVAGKTGTAQIANPEGGYFDVNTGPTNHTIVGFAPASTPRVVLLIKYGNVSNTSTALYAETTTGPVFRDIMRFTLEYLGFAPERKSGPN